MGFIMEGLFVSITSFTTYLLIEFGLVSSKSFTFFSMASMDDNDAKK